MTKILKLYVTGEAIHRQDEQVFERQWDKLQRRISHDTPEGMVFEPIIFTIEADRPKQQVWLNTFFDFTEDKPVDFIIQRLMHREYRRMMGEYVAPGTF